MADDSCDANGLSALQIELKRLLHLSQWRHSPWSSWYVADSRLCIMTIRQLLRSGADVNQLNSYGVSPLHSLLLALHNFRAHLLVNWNNSDRLIYADITQLIVTLIQHGANIDDSFCNLHTHCYKHLELEDFMIPFIPETDFIMELLKMGAGYKLVSFCCEPLRYLLLCPEVRVDVRLCKAVVMAGTSTGISFDQHILQHKVSDDHRQVNVEFVSWVNEEKQNAPSLLRQCRVSIRQQLSVACQHRNIIPAIDKLPLPEQLRRYLKFEGLLTEVDLSVSTEELGLSAQKRLRFFSVLTKVAGLRYIPMPRQ